MRETRLHKIARYARSIVASTERMTPGNVAHERGAIQTYARGIEKLAADLSKRKPGRASEEGSR